MDENGLRCCRHQMLISSSKCPAICSKKYSRLRFCAAAIDRFPPRRQELILKGVADRRWEAIPRASVHGHAMLRFLERVGEMCESETFKPSAPYAPGVTGFAISMADREFLVGDGARKSDSAKALRDVLASCIALNLLEPRLDAKNKGERWLVLYLNRLLCLRFGLPLGYGGWRPRKIKALTEWVGKASIAGAAGG